MRTDACVRLCWWTERGLLELEFQGVLSPLMWVLGSEPLSPFSRRQFYSFYAFVRTGDSSAVECLDFNLWYHIHTRKYTPTHVYVAYALLCIMQTTSLLKFGWKVFLEKTPSRSGRPGPLAKDQPGDTGSVMRKLSIVST